MQSAKAVPHGGERQRLPLILCTAAANLAPPNTEERLVGMPHRPEILHIYSKSLQAVILRGKERHSCALWHQSQAPFRQQNRGTGRQRHREQAFFPQGQRHRYR